MAIYPLAPGPTPPAHPDYSGKLIPQIWARKFLERFWDASVVPQISQNDYEGEIKGQGDKVTINKTPTVSISNYKMGDDLSYERPLATTIDLLIDQGKYWALELDDVADAQSFANLFDVWAPSASEQMKITVDTDVLAFLVGKATALNRGLTAGRVSGNLNLGTTAAPVAVSKTNVIDFIIDHGQALDEQNIPETGRKLVIPSWMASRIKKSDLKDAALTGDSQTPLRNGRIGMIDRFELYVSNLLPVSGANTYVYAIHPKALTFACQLTKTEKIRSESTFGDKMRGLMVYGRQVVLPEAMTEGVAVPA